MSKKSVKKPDYAKFEANRAVKKKNKKKKTTAIISSVIAACVFIIAAIVAVNVLSPSVTAELTSSAWIPEDAKNASGDEAEMSAYQGSMSFSDDGTFTLWLSPGSPDDGTHSGKYTVSASDKVNLSFDDGTNTSAALTQKNGKVSAVVLKYNDYEITFVKLKTKKIYGKIFCRISFLFFYIPSNRLSCSVLLSNLCKYENTFSTPNIIP